MRTLVIGRSPFADIVIAEASVASHHAEMVVTDDERYYLTDCGAATGTWLKAADGGSGDEWRPVRQTFVSADDTVRVGDHVVRVADMLRLARRPEDRAEPGAPGNGSEGGRRGAFRGRIERDPATGEIIRRRP